MSPERFGPTFLPPCGTELQCDGSVTGSALLALPAKGTLCRELYVSLDGRFHSGGTHSPDTTPAGACRRTQSPAPRSRHPRGATAIRSMGLRNYCCAASRTGTHRDRAVVPWIVGDDLGCGSISFVGAGLRMSAGLTVGSAWPLRNRSARCCAHCWAARPAREFRTPRTVFVPPGSGLPGCVRRRRLCLCFAPALWRNDRLFLRS